MTANRGEQSIAIWGGGWATIHILATAYSTPSIIQNLLAIIVKDSKGKKAGVHWVNVEFAP